MSTLNNSPAAQATNAVGAAAAAMQQPQAIDHRFLVESLPDVVWVLDVDSLRFIYVSQAVLGLRGLSVEEAMTESMEASVTPADRPRIQELLRLRVADFLAGRLAEHSRLTDDMELLRKDGSSVWVEVVSQFKRNVITGRTEIYGVTRDITQRRATQEALRLSEERHRLLAEQANSVVWTMALDGTITYVSPTVERIRGYTQDEAMRQPIEDILTPESQASAMGYFVDVFQAAQEGRMPDTYRGHQEYRCKDGSTLWCDVMAFPIAGSDGKFVELLGISSDINIRKRHEEQLRLAQAQTEHANQALREANEELNRLAALSLRQAEKERVLREEQEKLFAMLAHELKTPLATVRMIASSIHKEDAQEITRAIRDMNDVIERCVQSGQLADRRLIIHPQTCDLASLLKEVLGGSRWAKRLDLRSTPGLAPLQSDPQFLRIIVDNLIDNAGKYSPPESQVLIELALQQREGVPGCVIEVLNLPSDAGWPDPNSLFEKYYRAAHAKRQAGAGLGLFLVEGLVHLLGGQISYEPTSTHIRFCCWLPAETVLEPA